MKNSKKMFGLFAFLLISNTINASSVGAPEEYPGIKYNYNGGDITLPVFNFSESLNNGGNYIRVGGNSKLNIASNVNIDLKSNIPFSAAPNVYGNLVGFGAYGTNSAAPTINAKNVKIKVEVGASDYFNAPRGMIVNDGASYFGEDVDINLITNSRPAGNDIIGLSYEADNVNVTRAYKSEMNVNNVNIKIENNQVLTTGGGDNLLVGLWSSGDKKQNAHFISRGNLKIDINDKSNKAQYHAAAGIILAGDNGTKMTLNNSNIKIKSVTDNDYIGGAIVLGYPEYNNSDKGVGVLLESKGKMLLDTTEASGVAAVNLHGQGSLFKADFENSSTEIKAGGTAIRFAGISQALNADGENTKPGKDLMINLKNAKITSSATTAYSSPLILVEDGVKNATFNLTGPQSQAIAAVNNDLLLIRGKSSVTLNISNGAKITGIVSRASLGEITTNITNNAVWASPANKGSSYASTLTLKDGGTFDLSDNPNPSGVNYHEIKIFNTTETDGKIINDNGIITTANTSYNDLVEIYGNYEGKNGAKIKMNTQWNAPGDANGSNSKSDVIKILRSGIANSGNVTGVTGVVPVGIDGKENIIDGNIKKVAQAVNTIPVIIADNAQAGAFVGKAQTTGAGEVQLTSRLNGGQREFFWTLNAIDGTNPYDDGTSKNYNPHSSGKSVTILNSAVAGYINMPKVDMNLGFYSLASLHERRGENNINSKDGKSQAWLRIIGKHTKDEGKERFNFETDVYGVQAGYDFSIKNSENGKRYTGFYFTNTEAKTDFQDRYRAENGIIVSDKYTGKAKAKDFTLGLSTTKYYNNGLYLDLVGQFSFIKNKYDSRDGVSAKQKGNALGLSIETGKSYKIGTNWNIEPQVQLAYQYLKLKDFKDDVREVHYGNDSTLRARVGVKATYSNVFYSIANILHDFENETEANIGSDNIKEKYSSTWGEFGLGVQIPVTNSAYVYGDLRYESSFKSNPKHNGYKGTIGLKYTF